MKIREKILVIEDEQTIRNFMQAVLTANDYDVLLARTGAMGESMIASHCPDVIILDLGLPDVDGMEILRKVRRWSKVPILVVSARTHERDKVEALERARMIISRSPLGPASCWQGSARPSATRERPSAARLWRIPVFLRRAI